MDINNKTLSAAQVAQRLGMCQNHVCKLIREGKLKAYRPGARKYAILESDVEEFITNRMVKGKDGKEVI